MGRQGPEHKAAVDAPIPVDLLQGLDQGLLGHIGGQQELFHLHAHFFRPLGGPPLIGQVGRVLPHPHDGQGRHDARLCQPSLIFLDFLADSLGHRPAF